MDLEKLLPKVKANIVKKSVNNYAVERVVFGHEKPGDKAPIDLYLEHLDFDNEDWQCNREDIPDVYIDEQERISDEYDYAEYVRALFVYQMEKIFTFSPTDERLEIIKEEIPLQSPYREYVFGQLPLFTEVLNTEVENNSIDFIPTSDKIRAMESAKWDNLVTAILFEPLSSGSKIDKYLKGVKHPLRYIERLIEKRGRHFYLKPVDINSYEYIFALFSLMKFFNNENDKLFELKMFEWERQHKGE